jgi:guanylate kinase
MPNAARCWRCKHDVAFDDQVCGHCSTHAPVRYSFVWTRPSITAAPFLVVAGPTGGGKTVLADFLTRAYPSSRLLVWHTDRAQRKPPKHIETEIDGYHYYFVNGEWFDERIKDDALAAHVGRYGNRYGLALNEVAQCLDAHLVPVVVCNVDTALQLKRHYPSSAACFVCSRDIDAVRARAGSREEDQRNIAARIALLDEEMSARQHFDYVYEYEEHWSPGSQYYLRTSSSASHD